VQLIEGPIDEVGQVLVLRCLSADPGEERLGSLHEFHRLLGAARQKAQQWVHIPVEEGLDPGGTPVSDLIQRLA